jgi:hypothetical protein
LQVPLLFIVDFTSYIALRAILEAQN